MTGAGYGPSQLLCESCTSALCVLDRLLVLCLGVCVYPKRSASIPSLTLKDTKLKVMTTVLPAPKRPECTRMLTA
jgi:hypothetical protein